MTQHRGIGEAEKGHLVFFAYYYPPLGGAGSLRALSFVRHLTRRGWRVTVVTPRDGVYGHDPSLRGDDLPGVTVLRTGSWEPAVFLRRMRRRKRAGDGTEGTGGGTFVEEARLGKVGGLLRDGVRRALYFPDSSRGWVGQALRAARSLHRSDPVDLALSSSPPVSAHLAAARFAKATGVPWVADWRDPWSCRMEQDSPILSRARVLEERLLRDADALVTASGGFAAILRDAGAGDDPTVVRNGFEPGEIPPGPGRDTQAGFRLIHTGTVYGRDQDLDGFLRALHALRTARPDSPVTLELQGKVDVYTRGRIAELDLDEVVSLTGFRSHEESLRSMTAADALLLLTWKPDTEVGRAICPAKMYEYAAVAKPILCLAGDDNEAARLLSGLPAVHLREFDDADGIEQDLLTLMETPDNQAQRPWTWLRRHTRRAQARILDRVLTEVVSGRGRE